MIRQLSQELPDLGLLCLQKCKKASLRGKGLKEVCHLCAQAKSTYLLCTVTFVEFELFSREK